VVELAADNLAALPAEWADKSFGIAAPASVYARFWLVMSLAQLGRFDEAAEPSAEAIQIAEWTQRAFPAGLAHWASSTRCLLQGDWAKARTIIAQWLGGLAVDIAIQRVSAIAAAAWALAQLGDTTEALGRLREAEGLLERMAAQGFLYQRGWDYVSLGRACLVIDQPREAQRLGDRAVEASRRHAGFAAHARHLLGDVATHPDRFDAQRGEDHYRQALALAGARGMRPLVAHCHLGLGQLYVRTGRRDGAQGYLATAATLYREMGMSFYLAQAEAAVAEAER
jgi:tetratricopeptide (TPR) repeat protein